MKKVYDRANIVVLIKNESGDVFGGYTKNGWESQWSCSEKGYYSPDADAFVFQIKSKEGTKPFISNVKQDEESITTALTYEDDHDYWCMFEWVIAVYRIVDDHVVQCGTPHSYEAFENAEHLGSQYIDFLIEIEAFQISS